MKLELSNITKRFGDFVAVNNLSFTADKGELFSLVGPSGCGKTTVLRTIAGFYKPDEGAISLDDEDITTQPINKRGTAMVFQNYALFPHMTVYENIAFGLKQKKNSKKEIKEKVREVLHLIQLPGIGDKYPRELSGGMQQRVAIARAIVIQPRVLLLDEPLSNLDAKLREELRMEIRELQQKIGITTIFVTHDISEAFAMSDRIAVMEKGRIIQTGSPTEIYESPHNKFIGSFVGKYNTFNVSVVSVKGSLAKGSFGDDLKITINMNEGLEILKAGDQLNIMVRPERMRLSDNPTDDGQNNTYKTNVIRSFFLGNKTHYELLLGGEIIIVENSNDGSKIFKKGETCFVGWSYEDHVYFK